jgi:hypothetical protein
MAETKRDALVAFDTFVDKAVACLIKDRDALLALQLALDFGRTSVIKSFPRAKSAGAGCNDHAGSCVVVNGGRIPQGADAGCRVP